MRHIFKMGDQTIHVSADAALAVYALCKLTNPAGGSGYRVQAIKVLRTLHSNLGLLEGKRIVDYIADNGGIDFNGKLTLVVRTEIVYAGVEA